jgi:surfeit locus 1 family protein
MPAKRGTTRFRPSLWASVIAAPAFIALLGLGTWQVQRLEWKHDLIANREAAFGLPPAALPVDDKRLAGFNYRRVSIAGRFLHDSEFYLVPRVFDGRIGLHVVTPFERSAGPIVLVDRGWVPESARAPSTRVDGQVAGTVTVDGVARTTSPHNSFTPDNDAAANQWFWIDIPAMARHAGIALQPVFVEAGAGPSPSDLPVGGRTRVELRNNHLGYAVTWYALAAALAVIYALYHRRRQRGGRTPGGP